MMAAPQKTGFGTPLIVSPQMASIIGTAEGEKVSRPEVTKKLHAYIKRNNLQDPTDKRWFTPDQNMRAIFGSHSIECFSVTSYLKDHLTKPPPAPRPPMNVSPALARIIGRVPIGAQKNSFP